MEVIGSKLLSHPVMELSAKVIPQHYQDNQRHLPSLNSSRHSIEVCTLESRSQDACECFSALDSPLTAGRRLQDELRYSPSPFHPHPTKGMLSLWLLRCSYANHHSLGGLSNRKLSFRANDSDVILSIRPGNETDNGTP
jgi:hypothetical protein